MGDAKWRKGRVSFNYRNEVQVNYRNEVQVSENDPNSGFILVHPPVRPKNATKKKKCHQRALPAPAAAAGAPLDWDGT